MSDFTTIKAELVAQVLNSHPNTAALMAGAMVRQLLVLQTEPVTFMENSGSFSTDASETSYDSGTAGFPKSLLRFDRLYYDLGTYVIEIYGVDRDELRRLQELSPIAHPCRAAWIEEKLQFGPAPAAAYTVKYDCYLDATKDTATGNLITTASGSETNAWFTTGAVGFKAMCLADYYATTPDQRPEMAATWQQQAGLFIASYRRTQAQRLHIGGLQRLPSAFGQGNLSRSGRIQLLFPGAPV